MQLTTANESRNWKPKTVPNDGNYQGEGDLKSALLHYIIRSQFKRHPRDLGFPASKPHHYTRCIR